MELEKYHDGPSSGIDANVQASCRLCTALRQQPQLQLGDVDGKSSSATLARYLSGLSSRMPPLQESVLHTNQAERESDYRSGLLLDSDVASA